MGQQLHIREWGSGDAVVLVHGSASDGAECWSEQIPLASRGFRLIVPDRRGFGLSPSTDMVDFEKDAVDVASLLGEDAHVVGWSYGGVVALLAAAQRPDGVRSLVLVEPSAFSVALSNPEVAQFVAAWRSFRSSPDRESVFESMDSEQTESARRFIQERPPWEAQIPFEVLATQDFGKLVISGGHNVVFEAVADALAERLSAERLVVRSQGHDVQRAEGFNAALEAFLRRSKHGG